MALKKGKKAVTKKTAEKKVVKKEKVEPKKRPIGFEMSADDKIKIEEMFEKLNETFTEFGDLLNEYVYEGKKKAAKTTRLSLMDIIKTAKNLRNIVQHSKDNLTPIYKE